MPGWKRVVRSILLQVLMLAAFVVCAMAVLWIMGGIMGIRFENIVLSAVKVGAIAWVLIMAWTVCRRRKAGK